MQRIGLEFHRPGAEAAGIQRNAQSLLAGANVLEPRPRLILPQSRTSRRARQADQRGGVKGPFEERDVAQRFEQPYRTRITFEAPTARGQDNEGEV